MMRTKTPLATFLLTAIALAAAPAKAQSKDPAQSVGDPQQLVVGDWYDFTIERPGFKQPDGDGVLVKVTDDWIVIAKVLSEASDVRTGVPVLKDLPVVGKWFGKTTPAIYKAYLWIPRDAFRADKHEPIANQRFRAEFANDAPVLENATQPPIKVDQIEPRLPAPDRWRVNECDVYFVKEGKRARDGGFYLGISDGRIRLAQPTYETVLVQNPKWGGVPIVGDMLAKQEIVEKKVEKQVPLNDVLVVMTQRPLTEEETKFVISN
jgi:hypothetical protein